MYIKELPAEYIVFHCKSNDKNKDWPAKKWNKLADKILKQGINIVEVGLEPIISSQNTGYYDCTHIHDIQKIALFIKNAKCFIGIDTAFAHIANSFNVYSILIIGKTRTCTEFNPYSGNFASYQNCTVISTKDFSKYISVSVVYKEFDNFIKNKTSKLNRRIYVYKFEPLIKKILQNIFSVKSEFVDGVKKYKVITILGLKIKFKYKKDTIILTQKDKFEYIDYALNNQLDKSEFVELSEGKYKAKENDVKLIAFYLPQFHSFESNDRWFGRGFTEWSNVTKTVPQYTGHYQPHLPIDVGFYNLETTTTMKRQIELAKQYGIYGFCFYYYWYSGKKVMEKPIEAFLADKSLDMPFFMFWANEDWTHLWGSGADKEILFKQQIIEGDAKCFMDDILPYMKDDRYIKIDGKPLLIIYNPEIYPRNVLVDFIDKIRQIAKENGFDDLYINTIMRPYMQVGVYKDYLEENHLDGIVEFIPGGMLKLFELTKRKIINPLFVGHCFDVQDFVEQQKYIYSSDSRVFKGLFTSWDNTPRRCYKGANILQSSPKLYKQWLKDIIKWTKQNNPKNEQFIFINAWNEWAEGAHLEPDQHYGYAFLEATRKALEEDE